MAGMSLLGTLSTAHIALFTWLRGKPVGTDQFGNRYYRGRKNPRGQRERRWVIYAGEPDGSKIPPEWHAWIHFQVAEPPTSWANAYRQPWQKQYVPNMTGTAEAYRPPGHTLRGGRREAATGDYQPWTPPD